MGIRTPLERRAKGVYSPTGISDLAGRRSPILWPEVFVDPREDSLPEKTYLTYYMADNTILEAMTVLVPMIDERGVAYLAADGRVRFPDGKKEEYGLKTARINDQLCVGISGSVGYGNQIIAHIFNEHELAKYRAEINICKLLEAHGKERLGYPYEVAKDWITKQLRYWHDRFSEWKEGIPDLNVVLVGISSDGPRFCIWHCVVDWKEDEYPKGEKWKPGVEIGKPLGPIQYQKAADTLGQRNRPTKKRIKECIRLFAKKCPNAVNRNISLRRSNKDFKLEPSDWPGLDQAMWPSPGDAHP